jgi:hypothetical protein
MGQISVASYEVTSKATLLPLVMPEGFQAVIGLGVAGPESNLNLSSKEN